MLPLYEAKMIHQFDHRFGTYEAQSKAQANKGKLPELDHVAHADPRRVTLPKYWVPEDEVAARLDDAWDRNVGCLVGGISPVRRKSERSSRASFRGLP